MIKTWNFSAGPSTLPESVLQKAKEELTSYGDSGISVMEMSHRSTDFTVILKQAEQTLRELLDIPKNYQVLFLQGGASLQFSMVPMNLREKEKAAYIDTGSFSTKAQDEALRTGIEIDTIASSQDEYYTVISELPQNFSSYDYIHLTSNNTVEGTQFHSFPDTRDTPLVADMSSDLLSRPVDIRQFGLIYAGAQKNLGISGLTLVIIREDLLNKNPDLPNMLNYQAHAEKKSTYNTPPTFAIYISRLIFQWIKDLGGLEKMAELNRTKADTFYQYLDQSPVFQATVSPPHRSLMNIPFTTGKENWDKDFIDWCEKHKIKNIQGHRSVGGMRASIYNAMPLEGIEALIAVMKDFEKEKKKEATRNG